MLPRNQTPPEFASPENRFGVGADNDWLLWQLADSAFPTGGFAHSSGLEAAWQHGELRGATELKNFLAASLEQFGHGSLPFLLATFDDPERLAELDTFCDCFLTNHVANRASRLQGQALWSSAERIFNLAAKKSFADVKVLRPRFCHLSPVYGYVFRSLGISRSGAARLGVFLHLRGLISSAVRLGIVGPMEAQGIQHHCSNHANEVVEHCQNIAVEEVAQASPLLEIWQSAQDRLYSRLFQS